MLNILVTGATGMLGSAVVALLRDNYRITALGQRDDGYRLGVPFYKCDFSLDGSLELIRKKIKHPDIIIHCAGIIKHEFCDLNPDLAYKVNAESVLNISNTFPDSKIIYISTDAVFSKNTHLAKETSLTNPVSIYGKSKKLGEENTLKNENNLVVRTTIVGKNLLVPGTSFVEWILSNCSEKNTIKLYDDVFFNPITTIDLVKELEFSFKNNLNGVFDINGSEICSRYDFGYLLLNKLGLPLSNVIKTKKSEVDTSKNRSFDQTLSVSKYVKHTGRRLPTLSDTIYTLVNSYNFKFYENY